jgi:hypothetical protein
MRFEMGSREIVSSKVGAKVLKLFQYQQMRQPSNAKLNYDDDCNLLEEVCVPSSIEYQIKKYY